MAIERKKLIKILCFVFAFIILITLILSLVFVSKRRPDSNLHIDGSYHTIKYSENLVDIDLESPQAFVYDVSNDTIILTKGQGKVVYPGSISKLLTILYAMEILPLDYIVKPMDELDLVKPHSSLAYIKRNHEISVEMLIEGMLLPSGNDAAYVLAAACGRKISNDELLNGTEAVNVFMEHLNNYAESIGLCGTEFTVPDGYAGHEHYTTTEDVLLFTKMAYSNAIIRKYSGMSKDDVVYASGHTNTWINTNRLLDVNDEYYSKYANGLKTGSVDEEYSLAFSFKFEDGREYIASVFGGKNKNARFRDATKIIEFFKNQ